MRSCSMRHVRLLDRILDGAVGEEIAELAVAVADRLVQRDRRLDGVERLLDVVLLQLRRVRQLLDRRRAAVRRLELLAGAPQLEPALLDVDGDPDRVGLVRDRALAGLTDPPGRVGRELEALAVVELLHRAVEADRAVLDQVEQRQAVALVALRDRDDEAQVRVRHPLLRGLVALLDPLRERDLFGRGQERVPPDLVQEELQAVGAAAGRGAEVEPGLRVVGGRRLLDLDVGRAERSPQRLDGVLVEIVLELQQPRARQCPRCRAPLRRAGRR